MVGKKDKSRGKRKSPLNADDAALWKDMTRDVRRMPGRNYLEGQEVEEIEQNSSLREKITERVRVKTREEKPAPKGRDVDKRTAQRLARGQMNIEATLDLHGMSQQEARGALERFIKNSHARGRRCVLVVTGKGRQEGQGVLKRRVPEWLNEGALEGLVLKTAQAKQGDGGAGAIYVLLRRNRQ